jgi:hypothetical protein
MGQQLVRQAARRSALDAQAVLRRAPVWVMWWLGRKRVADGATKVQP